jgi:hypothetical protein
MREALLSASPEMSWHRGGCHCGAVQFEVAAPDNVELIDCNCSMCVKTGFLHLIVPKSRFKLLTSEKNLATYTFNTGAAQHMFCSVCGIKSFYVPRSHPDGYSVNFRCLDAEEFGVVSVVPFDGAHWDEHAADLKPLEAN